MISNQSNTIEIRLSKTKLLLAICVAILFVVLCYYIFDTLADSQTRYNPIFMKGISVGGMLMFSIGGIYGIKKLFDQKAGLIINDIGIIDNTNAASIGLIKWSDITEIKRAQIMSTKFLLIYIRDPNGVLESVSGVKHKLLAGNMAIYETPFAIASTSLNYNFNDLEALLVERLRKYQEKISNL